MDVHAHPAALRGRLERLHPAARPVGHEPDAERSSRRTTSSSRAGTFDGQSGNIVVVLPTGTGECGAITFTIQVLDHDTSGHITAFSGQATGRCCGTILETFRFVRAAT